MYWWNFPALLPRPKHPVSARRALFRPKQTDGEPGVTCFSSRVLPGNPVQLMAHFCSQQYSCLVQKQLNFVGDSYSPNSPILAEAGLFRPNIGPFDLAEMDKILFRSSASAFFEYLGTGIKDKWSHCLPSCTLRLDWFFASNKIGQLVKTLLIRGFGEEKQLLGYNSNSNPISSTPPELDFSNGRKKRVEGERSVIETRVLIVGLSSPLSWHARRPLRPSASCPARTSPSG